MTIPVLLVALFGHASSRRKRQFFLLLVLTLVSSLAEIMSLGAIVPFIGVLTQPDTLYSAPWLAGTIERLEIGSADELVVPLTMVFAAAALVAGAIRLILLWISIRLGNATGADLGIEIFKKTLYQSYSVHVAQNSSEIISAITQKVSTATTVLISTVTVFTSATLFLAIMTVLLVVDPFVAIIASLSFGSLYVIISLQTRSKLQRNSKLIAEEQTRVVKALQEGLGAIRDVLLDGTQSVYSEIYRGAVLKLQRATADNAFMSQAPRYAMEAVGIALIALFALVLSLRPGGVSAALPLLGMIALGAQRLLPLMQQLYLNWAVLTGSRAALVDVLRLLEQPLPEEAYYLNSSPVVMKNSIQCDNVSFHYGGDGPEVLSNINLNIRKGSRVGFIGTTGCGKSTLLDLMMGLLEPTKGAILVDGKVMSAEYRRSWQMTIAHVPQSIYLADSTILENIAFGVPLHLIDIDRVRAAAKQAKLADFIENRAEGYSAVVGERGVRISGGQRQRIGIARALYKQATVLVFDEATSALDSETERLIMETIEDLDVDLTILIIAHRLTTLKNCSQIVELDKGEIKRIGSFKEIAE